MFRSAEMRYGSLKERVEAQQGELLKLQASWAGGPHPWGHWRPAVIGAAAQICPVEELLLHAPDALASCRSCALAPGAFPAGAAGGSRGRVLPRPRQAQVVSTGAGEPGQQGAQQRQGGTW